MTKLSLNVPGPDCPRWSRPVVPFTARRRWQIMRLELYKGSYRRTASHQVMRKPHPRPNSDLGTKLFLESKHQKLPNNLDSELEHPPTLGSFRFPLNILYDRKNSLKASVQMQEAGSCPLQSRHQTAESCTRWTRPGHRPESERQDRTPGHAKRGAPPPVVTVVSPYTWTCYCDHLRAHFSHPSC